MLRSLLKFISINDLIIALDILDAIVGLGRVVFEVTRLWYDVLPLCLQHNPHLVIIGVLNIYCDVV